MAISCTRLAALRGMRGRETAAVQQDRTGARANGTSLWYEKGLLKDLYLQ